MGSSKSQSKSTVVSQFCPPPLSCTLIKLTSELQESLARVKEMQEETMQMKDLLLEVSEDRLEYLTKLNETIPAITEARDCTLKFYNRHAKARTTILNDLSDIFEGLQSTKEKKLETRVRALLHHAVGFKMALPPIVDGHARPLANEDLIEEYHSVAGDYVSAHRRAEALLKE